MTVLETTSWLPTSWFAAVSGQFHSPFCQENGRSGGECQGIGQYKLYQPGSVTRVRTISPGNATGLAAETLFGQIQHPSNPAPRSRECPSKIGDQAGGGGETLSGTLTVSRAVTGYEPTGGEGVSPLVAPSGKPGSDMVRTRFSPSDSKIGPTPVPRSTISPGSSPVVKVNGVFDPADDPLPETAKGQVNGGHGPLGPYDAEPHLDIEPEHDEPIPTPTSTPTSNQINLTLSRMNNGVQ